MATYTLNTEDVKSVKQIATMMELVIKTETSAIAEVTLVPDMMLVYTEETDKIDSIKALFLGTRNLVDEINYDVDEDGPAATTLKYSL
jgi:hypothetical protein